MCTDLYTEFAKKRRKEWKRRAQRSLKGKGWWITCKGAIHFGGVSCVYVCVCVSLGEGQCFVFIWYEYDSIAWRDGWVQRTHTHYTMKCTGRDSIYIHRRLPKSVVWTVGCGCARFVQVVPIQDYSSKKFGNGWRVKRNGETVIKACDKNVLLSLNKDSERRKRFELF